jgi:penicillin-insensitive murein endopeptidase
VPALSVICTLVFATAAAASPDGMDGPIRSRTGGTTSSSSTGYPFRGRLHGGRRLEESAAVRFVASEMGEERNVFGTDELVGALDRAATRLGERFRGARLPVGELSAERGGRIRGHRSHQSGRDADIGFVLRDRRGRFAEPDEFVDIGRGGVGVREPYAGLRFDTAANLLVLEDLFTNPDIHVQFVFVSRGLAAQVLAAAERTGVARHTRERMRETMIQPRRHAHRNHFHVRVYCAGDDQPECRDRGPFRTSYPFAPAWATR